MMKKSFILLILLISGTGSFGQLGKAGIDVNKINQPQSHYQTEYTFDTPSDSLAWTSCKKGLNGGFGSTDQLYLRCEFPDEATRSSIKWESTGWKGERLNAQVLVWSEDSLEQLRFKLNDLKGSDGKFINKSNIKLKLVRYVVSNFPYGATNFNCDVGTDSAWLLPDRLEALDRFDLPGRTVRPVWVSFEIPRDCRAGDYNTTIEIKSEKENILLNVKITVQSLVLPDPHDWKFRLDLWQNPWVIAEYYNVKPWSEEHILLLNKHLKLYADAGGKYITTYAVHSPWSDNSYYEEGNMIEWTKKTDGEWEFNYSIFDKYVETAMENGIDKAITIYTPLPWGNRFRYLDEKSGNEVYVEWSPESEEYKTNWDIFLTSIKKHLILKGWFSITYMGINENLMEYTLASARIIKENSKDWKITYAGDWHPELSDLLDDYSTVISSEPDSKELNERSQKGFTSSYYVCCTPPRPNNFVFSPPAESRYIGWHAAAKNYDGFLRWAYDAWPADPSRDARHTLWPAGDCFLIYPGGNSSIRFEKLREGIVDYEKIYILREMTLNSNNSKAKKLISSLDAHLSTLITEANYSDRDYSIERIIADLNKGQTLITDLSKELESK